MASVGASVRLAAQQRRAFLRKRVFLPGAIFAGTIAAYLLMLIAALAADNPWVSIIVSAACGLTIGLMFIVGHDACHQSFTASRMANAIIGRIAFLPSLHPFSLWDLGHNRTHHRYNNVRGEDYVWEPMSPADYAAAGPIRRRLYRFYRSPVGVCVYYGAEIWARRMFFVNPWRMPGRRAAYTGDLLTVWLALPALAAAIVLLGRWVGKGPGESLLLGLVLPFLIWNALMSFVIYLHHTHPCIRWYRSIGEWREADGRVAGTVHARFPPAVGGLLLNIMEHNAHHYAPGVPLYNLVGLQRRMDAQGALAWDWSLSEFLRICRECKLFDYDSGSWRPFDMRP